MHQAMEGLTSGMIAISEVGGGMRGDVDAKLFVTMNARVGA